MQDSTEILNRYITTPTKSYNYSLRFSYSEPIFRGGFLQFSYNFQYKHSNTDNSTYDMPLEWTIDQGFVPAWGSLNTDLSKKAEYNYYNHQADVALRWIRQKMQLNVGCFIPAPAFYTDLSDGRLCGRYGAVQSLTLLRLWISVISLTRPVSCVSTTVAAVHSPV